MTAHSCEPPVDPIHGPDTWTCPACCKAWERREEYGGENFDDANAFYDTWFEPRE